MSFCYCFTFFSILTVYYKCPAVNTSTLYVMWLSETFMLKSFSLCSYWSRSPILKSNTNTHCIFIANFYVGEVSEFHIICIKGAFRGTNICNLAKSSCFRFRFCSLLFFLLLWWKELLRNFICTSVCVSKYCKYRISQTIRRTFFPEKCDLNSTCVLYAEGKYLFPNLWMSLHLLYDIFIMR